MPDVSFDPRSEKINPDNLGSKFLTLRVGEEILAFEVKDIRKVTNSAAQNNLYGVDYRYVMENQDGKLLTVSSWVFWRQVLAALKQAGKSKNVVLELKHLDVGKYSVRVV